MRAIDCSCGTHIEAEDDEALFPKVKAHTQQSHPEWNATDERVRNEIKTHAHDVDKGK